MVNIERRKRVSELDMREEEDGKAKKLVGTMYSRNNKRWRNIIKNTQENATGYRPYRKWPDATGEDEEEVLILNNCTFISALLYRHVPSNQQNFHYHICSIMSNQL